MIEAFEDVGEFWLPEKKDQKVGGALLYSPGERPKLRLAGSFKSLREELQSFGSFKLRAPETIVLGQTAKSRNVTLYECRDAGGGTVDLEYGGAVEKWMEASVLFKGAHFRREEEIRFDSVAVEMAHLHEWAWMFVVDPRDCTYDRESRVQTLRYQHPSSVEVGLSDGWLTTLEVALSGPHFTRPQRTLAVKPQTRLKLVPPAPASLDSFLERIWIWSSFVSLATQEAVFPTRLTGRPTRTFEEGRDDYSGSDVEIVYRDRRLLTPIRELVPPHDMLFGLRDIAPDPSAPLRSWEDAARKLRPVLHLYFADLEQQGIHLEPRFLRLIQALEGYHRRVLGGTERPAAEHDERVEAILASVPREHAGWLRGKLKYANELSLGARLSALCRRHTEIMKHVASDMSWIDVAVGIRNDYSHQKQDAKEYEVHEVLTVSERLKLLLDLCLLSECGLDSQDIQKLVDRYWQRHPPILAIDAEKAMIS
jgi:hypothetical protein